ncbi:MAG: hypothetical protein K0U93_26685 [Gammaproteobacteria bacterium]|nr:hypothetical protein [Gammaproteobacteria bacterium]
MSTIQVLLNHPVTHLLVGGILLVTCAIEGWDTLREDLSSANIRLHHGIFAYALVNCLRAATELYEGVEHLAKARRERIIEA